MLACVLLRPCPYYFIIGNVQNVLISALAYVEYHIPRIKSDDELRLYSNIMKRPGEKWDLTGHLRSRLPTTRHELPAKPQSAAAASEGGSLDLGAISAFALGQMKTEALSVFFQYAQLIPSAWMITVLREFVTGLRNLAATTWASLSGLWSWSSSNHSSCGESSGGCERASVRDGLPEAPFLPGDHRETDTKS